jgi:hypothetical protein
MAETALRTWLIRNEKFYRYGDALPYVLVFCLFLSFFLIYMKKKKRIDAMCITRTS